VATRALTFAMGICNRHSNIVAERKNMDCQRSPCLLGIYTENSPMGIGLEKVKAKSGQYDGHGGSLS